MKIPSLVLLLTGISLAQGPLAPTTAVNPTTGPIAPLTGGGVPQPTMRTLFQIEPRTPLVAGSPGVNVSGGGNISISQPGSYYLTGNLQVASGNAITFYAENITLDLSGFTISSTASPADGVAISNTTNTGQYVVRNGFIRGTGTVDASGVFSGAGFLWGINLYSSSHTTVTGIDVEGVQGFAIGTQSAPDSTNSIVDGCSATNCGYGISAHTIKNCNATKIGGWAILGILMHNCHGSSITNFGIGCNAATGCIVNACSGTTASTAINYAGIHAYGNMVINSTGKSGGGSSYAITAAVANSCIASGPTNIVNKYNMP